MGRELWTALLALFCIGPITGEGRLIEETASQVQDVYEDSWLLEQLENELRLDREMMEDFGTSQSVMEYFLFDLNSDGVDEYIVSLCGSGWIGSSSNTVIFLLL